MSQDENLIKYPRLRTDLKFSKMVQRESIQYVVKDPLKEQYFRFAQDEWNIISLFDGHKTFEEMVKHFNETHNGIEIDLELVKNYRETLDSMNLLQKSKKEMNIMLVEKAKEMRQSQLLSKSGSLMYKRFPLVDPDKIFNKLIPHVKFFWSKSFFIFSASLMLISALLVLSDWQRFETGIREVFTFSNMSLVNLICLWVAIYFTIAIHEVGHGLTCKYYGGEVHEIGFLLLFFQPCLYCNVNDAWLFDKKWKQIIVTIAGGYIEFFIGSLCTFIWYFTSPNTFINVLSFQVMTICSVSTVIFNFNPLVKLDGYYLLADFLEIPNLKENSGKYIKYISSKYLFKMKEEEFEATSRESKILFCYGIASTMWTVMTITGLITMAQSMLVDKFHAAGVLASFWVMYKVLGGYIVSSKDFLKNWVIQHITFLKDKKGKRIVGTIGALILFILLFPIHYQVIGECTLEPNFSRIVRAKSEGKIISFESKDGTIFSKNQPIPRIANLENFNLPIDRKIAELNVEKVKLKIQKDYYDNREDLPSLEKELQSKQYELSLKLEREQGLAVTYDGPLDNLSLLSCADWPKKLNSFIKEGDEICKVLGIEQMKTVISVLERDIRYMTVLQPVNFRLSSNPLESYEGHISNIRPSGQSDPKNPKNKIYQVELLIKNKGDLRPAMKGKAKIYANKVPIIQYMGIKLSSVLRLDLFY